MKISLKQKLIERCQQLIEKGEQIKETRKSPPPNVIGGVYSVDIKLFYAWKNSVENLIIKISSKGSSYHKDFYNHVTDNALYKLKIGIGILESLKEELEEGFLEAIQNLITAEVFTDFLDTANYLLSNGYKDPAAVLAGTVLENGLKKIAKKNNISIQGRHGKEDGIGVLNNKLSQQQIYNELKKRSIHAWKEIRDSAAHGKFNEYTKNDVKTMVDGISGFLSEYF